MDSGSRWVDDPWWRDWLPWLGVVAATTGLVVALAVDGASWWRLVLGWLVCFGVTVAAVGFGRTAVRAYRAPRGGSPR